MFVPSPPSVQALLHSARASVSMTDSRSSTSSNGSGSSNNSRNSSSSNSGAHHRWGIAHPLQQQARALESRRKQLRVALSHERAKERSLSRSRQSEQKQQSSPPLQQLQSQSLSHSLPSLSTVSAIDSAFEREFACAATMPLALSSLISPHTLPYLQPHALTQQVAAGALLPPPTHAIAVTRLASAANNAVHTTMHSAANSTVNTAIHSATLSQTATPSLLSPSQSQSTLTTRSSFPPLQAHASAVAQTARVCTSRRERDASLVPAATHCGSCSDRTPRRRSAASHCHHLGSTNCTAASATSTLMPSSEPQYHCELTLSTSPSIASLRRASVTHDLCDSLSLSLQQSHTDAVLLAAVIPHDQRRSRRAHAQQRQERVRSHESRFSQKLARARQQQQQSNGLSHVASTHSLAPPSSYASVSSTASTARLMPSFDRSSLPSHTSSIASLQLPSHIASLASLQSLHALPSNASTMDTYTCSPSPPIGTTDAAVTSSDSSMSARRGAVYVLKPSACVPHSPTAAAVSRAPVEAAEEKTCGETVDRIQHEPSTDESHISDVTPALATVSSTPELVADSEAVIVAVAPLPSAVVSAPTPPSLAPAVAPLYSATAVAPAPSTHVSVAMPPPSASATATAQFPSSPPVPLQRIHSRQLSRIPSRSHARMASQFTRTQSHNRARSRMSGLSIDMVAEGESADAATEAPQPPPLTPQQQQYAAAEAMFAAAIADAQSKLSAPASTDSLTVDRTIRSLLNSDRRLVSAATETVSEKIEAVTASLERDEWRNADAQPGATNRVDRQMSHYGLLIHREIAERRNREKEEERKKKEEEAAAEEQLRLRRQYQTKPSVYRVPTVTD